MDHKKKVADQGDLESNLAPLDSPTVESEQEVPFSWGNPDDPSIVIPRQPAIAVYVNQRDEIVIRQEADMGFDEDEYVFVNIDNVEKLIDGIRARAFPEVTKLKVNDQGGRW